MKIDKTKFKLETAVERLLPARNQSMYFASAQALGFKENSTWEELTCVGYNPESRKLEAIVQLKQAFGYSGGLCTNGSTEFVRFFIDWGSGFEDVGLTGFKAFDVPNIPSNNHPLHFMVQQTLNEATHRKICTVAVLPKVRAILSWNSIPSLDPNQTVGFGNKLDGRIQIKPRRWFLRDLLDISKIKIAPELSEMLQLNQVLTMEKQVFSYENLLKVNMAAKVPAHRTLHSLMSEAAGFSSVKMAKNAAFEKIDLSKFGLNWTDIFKGYDKEFNTSFEELTCVGLNAANDTLGAVVHIKKRNGYSGSLCQKGSIEYVAFWGDFDNNGVFEYLGTSEVEVHDIGQIPDEGLNYNVQLPLNLEPYLQKCSSPRIAKIRAVLSWQTPPSTTDANASVYWGNRREVRVLLRAKGSQTSDLHFHYHDIGGVQEDLIQGGLAYQSPMNEANNNRPFGGTVHIGGRFGSAGVHYKVEYSANGITWQPAKTGVQSFAVFNPVTNVYQIQSQNSIDGWYTSVENLASSTPVDEQNATLVDWNTVGLQGNYQIRVLYTLDPSHSSFIITAPKDVMINNIRYDANSAFHNYMAGGLSLSSVHSVDMIFDNGGGCISQPKGTNFTGSFKATHTYFSQVQLLVLPANSNAVLSSGVVVTPPNDTLVRAIDASHSSGFGSETWELSTGALAKCGYVLVLNAFERTIYNNDQNLPFATVSIGFAVI